MNCTSVQHDAGHFLSCSVFLHTLLSNSYTSFFSQRIAVRMTSFQVLPTSLSKYVLVENFLNEGLREH